jgi:hypothetical protein
MIGTEFLINQIRKGGEKVKKTAFLTLAMALLIIGAAAAPVMAIGPFGAMQNDNPNFSIDPIGAVHNACGKSGVSIIWTPMPIGGPYTFWSEQRFKIASSGGGQVNNALIADPSTFSQWAADMQAYPLGDPTVNENKWIFLSPDGSDYPQYPFGPSGSYGTHGMLWFYIFVSMITGGVSGPAAAAGATAAVADYPNGWLWQYNLIG